jgi:biopolymer transport protein ExbD
VARRANAGAASTWTGAKTGMGGGVMTPALAIRRRGARHHPAAEPNVIPFIDVLLVLLIIFMVTAPKPTVDLQVDMPRERRSQPPLIRPTIVELREYGGGYRVLVGERNVSQEQLASSVLAHVLAADPVLTRGDAFADARIYVRSDQGVAYGNVVAVIDELQHAGFEKVSVFAQTAEGS